MSSPWQSARDRYSMVRQNIIKKNKICLAGLHFTRNFKQPDTGHAILCVRAVPAKSLLVTRLKHLDPEFAQNEACKTRTVFCNMGFVYLERTNQKLQRKFVFVMTEVRCNKDI